MERLLPDVDYHIHPYHKNYSQLGKTYSDGPPLQDTTIKQEAGATTFMSQYSVETTTITEETTNSRAIMHVSCENQHVSAGIETVHSTENTMTATQHATSTSVKERLNYHVDQNTLVYLNHHTFTNMAYNSSQNSRNSTGPCPSQSMAQQSYQRTSPQDLNTTANMHASRRSTNCMVKAANASVKPIRHGLMRYCGVCGDVAKSYHFGGLSCDSCKAFFRRSVHNDNYLHFQCYHNGHCSITVNNRKSCQYCRMKGCLGIGMEKGWVMTEEERKALMKTRAENRLKKQLAATASLANSKSARRESFQNFFLFKLNKEGLKLNSYEPRVEQMIEYLSIVEMKAIELVVTKYMSAYQQVPYRAQLKHFNDNRPGFQVMEMFGTLIRRFAVYARMMETFTNLPSEDQRVLLKHGVLEMCILRGAQLYDPVANRWPKVDSSIFKTTPMLKLDNITQLTSSLVFRKHMEFVVFIQQLHLDEPSVMLLVLIVLFTKRPGLLRPETVEKCQAYYVSLLERYFDWRFGPLLSKEMFNQLLTKLSDLRALSDAHNQENMCLGKDELSSIQQQLQHLKISPYAKINILQEENVGTQQTNEARQCQDASTTCQHQSPAYNNAVGQVDVTQGMRHDAAFTCFNPESSQQSLDNSTSFLSSPSSSNSSSDLNPENIGALTLRKDFGKRGFLQHSSHQVSFASFANQQEHLVQEQHVAQQAADQSQLMKLANVDYKTDGLIEASDLVRTLGPGSTGSFESQLSTSSLPGAGAAGLRFSQTVWQGGGSESTVEQINESSVTDPLSCLTPTATVELFNELERYSDLYPY